MASVGRRVTRTPRTPSTPEPTDRQTTYGVDEGADVQPIMALLKDDHNDPTKPYCTCTSRRTGFGFDPQLGVYLHADPKCWRPSKSYYEAARQAGVLESERGSNAEREESAAEAAGRREEPVPGARRTPGDGAGTRRPRTRRAEAGEDASGQPGAEPGADEAGGGDVPRERRTGPAPSGRRIVRGRAGQPTPCKGCGKPTFGGRCAKCRGER